MYRHCCYSDDLMRIPTSSAALKRGRGAIGFTYVNFKPTDSHVNCNSTKTLIFFNFLFGRGDSANGILRHETI